MQPPAAARVRVPTTSRGIEQGARDCKADITDISITLARPWKREGDCSGRVNERRMGGRFHVGNAFGKGGAEPSTLNPEP